MEVRTQVRLGPRQQEILWLVAKGETNKQIARALGISNHTVKNTLMTLYRKLAVRNRAGAAVEALTQGLFDEELADILTAAPRRWEESR